MYLQNVKKKVSYFRKFKKILDKYNLSFLLFNRTLVCAETVSLLSHDSYDDVVVNIELLKKKKLIRELKKNFKVVIKTHHLELYYDNFLLNVYLINFNQKLFIFNGLKLETSYFKKIKKIKIMNNVFKIPLNYKVIFKKIFLPSNIQIILSPFSQFNKSFISRVKNSSIALFYILFFGKKYTRYELYSKIFVLYSLNFVNFIKSGLNKFKKKKIYKISFSSFEKLLFDPSEYNWFFRKKHYSLIMKDNKSMSIKHIIKFLRRKKINKIAKKIIETKMNSTFDEPIYLNQRFWKTGNNFFIYAIIYGFKKNVVGYQKVNDYIKKKLKPNIYTKNYYKKLDEMNETEISNYLNDNPLPINEHGFLSGRHRVAAMIGRILRGEKYIPFNVYKT